MNLIHDRLAGEGQLVGRICISTVARQDFGKGIAQELYKGNTTIVVANLNKLLANQVAAESGGIAYAVAVNDADEENVANIAAQTVERYGSLDGCEISASTVPLFIDQTVRSDLPHRNLICKALWTSTMDQDQRSELCAGSGACNCRS